MQILSDSNKLNVHDYEFFSILQISDYLLT